ncbi:L-threonylcarbamoyladenylate synthase [Vreelandella utahensis]|uniref:L-threonylcarbamoyladenylate synthase n=1 Tax=Vreelandella halophila TaxID=86177 RepID=UPI001FED0974|nr:L-threonylcarbamoyladenylate synthase [Halomonas utahensis]
MTARSPDWWHIEQAADSLMAGGVWAYPTEAVWGLGCDPWDPEAVERILALKGRPWHKGLILVAADAQQLDFLLADAPSALRRAVDDYWPGANTLLLPDPGERVPSLVRGDHDRVAVRVPDHPQVRRLCRAFGGPLVSTSCNRAGGSPLRWSWQIQRAFGRELDGILTGSLGGARRPSRIIDPMDGTLLRD